MEKEEGEAVQESGTLRACLSWGFQSYRFENLLRKMAFKASVKPGVSVNKAENKG